MNRGARRAPIFFDDGSRRLFLSILGELPKRFGVRIHGYALMPNHYHLMLESLDGGLSRAMRHLGGEFTRQLNAKHEWDGPLFRGRYHNRLVETDRYWRHLLVYLHLNPVRAGISDLTESDWTSHQAYLDVNGCPDWLTRGELAELFGSLESYLQAHRGPDPSTDHFDPQKLWAPNAFGTVDLPLISEPFRTLDRAMTDVCRVTSMPVGQVVAAPVGRHPNRACWIAAWWLSRGCGIPHGEIRVLLGTSHAGVSRRIRYVERRLHKDPVLKGWAQQLQQLQQSKVVSGGT